MGGTRPRIDKIGKRRMEYGEQKLWWCEVFALGLRLGYKRLVPNYPDQKAANVSIIKDCLHRTQPARYYVTDPTNDDRVVQLGNEKDSLCLHAHHQTWKFISHI
jgi:hypothetical protein